MAQTCSALQNIAREVILKYDNKRDLYRRSRQTQIYGTDKQFRLSVSQHNQFEDQYYPLCELFAVVLDEEVKFLNTPRLKFGHNLDTCKICQDTKDLYEGAKIKGKLDGCHPDYLLHTEWLNRASRPLHAPIIARKTDNK